MTNKPQTRTKTDIIFDLFNKPKIQTLKQFKSFRVNAEYTLDNNSIGIIKAIIVVSHSVFALIEGFSINSRFTGIRL